MATSFETKIAVTGFLWTIATTDNSLWRWFEWSADRLQISIADTLNLRDVASATIFWLSMYGVHIDAIWRIRLNRPFAAAMRPYVKLLWPHVIIRPHRSTTYEMRPVLTDWVAWSVGLSH